MSKNSELKPNLSSKRSREWSSRSIRSRCHSVLGMPIPKSLAFWACPSHITAAFWASPDTLPGCTNPWCFGHPFQTNAGFRGKIENMLEMVSAKYRNLFQYLKKRAYPEGFTKQEKTTLRKFAKKFEYDSKLESLFCVAKIRIAQRFDDLLSPRKRGSSKSATTLPSAIILLGKSKSGFTGLTTTRTRWKWLVTNFIYLPMYPLDRGF